LTALIDPWIGLSWQLIAMTQNVWKVAALVNFLIFLMDGKYRFLVERLLHIRPVFEKPQGVRQVRMGRPVASSWFGGNFRLKAKGFS